MKSCEAPDGSRVAYTFRCSELTEKPGAKHTPFRLLNFFPNLFAKSFLKKNPDSLNELVFCGKKQSSEGIAAALQAMLTRRATAHVDRFASFAQCWPHDDIRVPRRNCRNFEYILGLLQILKRKSSLLRLFLR